MFCNRSCSATFNNGNKPKKEKTIKKSLVQKYIDGEYDGTVKHGLSSVIRLYVLEQANFSCEVCGFKGINPASKKTVVTVDHIDGNSQNNKRENLRALCPNHHAMTPTYGALNRGNGRKSRY